MSSLPSIPDVLAEVERSLGRHPRVALCHLLRCEGSTPGKTGWRLLVRPDGTVFGNLGGGAFEAMVQVDALARLETGAVGAAEPRRYYLTEKAVQGEATGMVCGGMAEVLIEVLEARPVLVICGGGPVGQAIAAAGELAGFDLLLLEDRPEFLEPRLFPRASQLLPVDRAYETPLPESLDARQLYVTVVTRCWETDCAALRCFAQRPPAGLAYLGLMGSRRKVRRVEAELAGLGIDLSRLPFSAPIGLPVGGDTPGEIAIAILAEILAHRHGRRVQLGDSESALPISPALPA